MDCEGFRMSIIWSFVWGMLVFAAMLITIKYYLPRLSERARISASEANTSSECIVEDDNNIIRVDKCVYNNAIFNNRMSTILMLVLCTCFAVWCGYRAAIYSVSAVSIVKMTVAMGVLSCIFITDMELMIIPNMCSVVLIVGRLLTIIYEFIWMRADAVVWFLNSIIVMVVCLLFLLIISKITHGGLGMGDVKLFSSLGFLCGARAVAFTLLFAFMLCAFASTGLLVTKKKKLKDSLPMGPFIWLGYGVTVLLAII